MSGVFAVPLTIIGCLGPSGWIKVTLLATGICCALYSAFWVWRAERLARIALADQLETLVQNSEPKLIARFDESAGKSFLLSRDKQRQIFSLIVENTGGSYLKGCEIRISLDTKPVTNNLVSVPLVPFHLSCPPFDLHINERKTFQFAWVSKFEESDRWIFSAVCIDIGRTTGVSSDEEGVLPLFDKSAELIAEVVSQDSTPFKLRLHVHNCDGEWHITNA